jgi:hypothetical protein
MTLSTLNIIDPIKFDKRIKHSFIEAVDAVKHGARLSLTSIGRSLAQSNNSIEKYGIKRIDRLLGNQTLHQNRINIYQQLAIQFSNIKQLFIAIDWSSVYSSKFVMLRAAVAFKGRAFTLYEEVHPENTMGNSKIQSDFLKTLKHIIPKSCEPVIYTDAGFKVPWFKDVEALGWHWLARTRGLVKCITKELIDWQYTHDYHHLATSKPMELEGLLLGKRQKHSCRGVLFKGKKQVQKSNKKPKRPNCNDYKKHKKSSKEPWFLVSNLPKATFNAQNLVNIYKRRMTIEEAFRDTKNEYYGLGLKRSRSNHIERLQTLLLIALIAQYTLYVIGKAAEILKYHYDFQANTIKNRRVLSYCYLGKRILAHKNYHIPECIIKKAQRSLINEAK